MPPKKYCGSKDPPPKGRERDTPYNCYKKGMGVGYKIAEEGVAEEIQKQKEKALKSFERGLRTGARAGLKEGKKRRGAGKLSRKELEALHKGELEAIAQRQGITGGRSKTKATLVNEIIAKHRGQ